MLVPKTTKDAYWLNLRVKKLQNCSGNRIKMLVGYANNQPKLTLTFCFQTQPQNFGPGTLHAPVDSVWVSKSGVFYSMGLVEGVYMYFIKAYIDIWQKICT